MKRSEWLAASDQDDVSEMLQIIDLRGDGGERVSRLWVCAVLKRAEAGLSALGKEAIELAERYADGRPRVDDRSLERMYAAIEGDRQKMFSVRNGTKPSGDEDTARYVLSYAVQLLCHKRGDFAPAMVCWTATSGASPVRYVDEKYVAFALLDVLGDPWWEDHLGRRALRGGWRTGPGWPAGLSRSAGWVPDVPLSQETLEVARGIYLSGRFCDSPQLADLLERKSEAPEHFIEHLRQPEHVRGCWALDLLLELGNVARWGGQGWLR